MKLSMMPRVISLVPHMMLLFVNSTMSADADGELAVVDNGGEVHMLSEWSLEPSLSCNFLKGVVDTRDYFGFPRTSGEEQRKILESMLAAGGSKGNEKVRIECYVPLETIARLVVTAPPIKDTSYAAEATGRGNLILRNGRSYEIPIDDFRVTGTENSAELGTPAYKSRGQDVRELRFPGKATPGTLSPANRERKQAPWVVTDRSGKEHRLDTLIPIEYKLGCNHLMCSCPRKPFPSENLHFQNTETVIALPPGRITSILVNRHVEGRPLFTWHTTVTERSGATHKLIWTDRHLAGRIGGMYLYFPSSSIASVRFRNSPDEKR